MRIKTDKVDGILVVMLMEGSMDASAAPEIKQRVLDFIGRGDKNIVLNLSRLRFMDSTGLGAVISILKALGRDGYLGLCCVPESIMDIIRLTRLDRALKIYPTQETALAEMARSPDTSRAVS